jgi:hypothetical protein
MDFKDKHFKKLWKSMKPTQDEIKLQVTVASLEKFVKAFYLRGAIDMAEQINDQQKKKE